MPYIPKEARPGAAKEPNTTGELNFAITHLLDGYLLRHGKSYATINECVGALECAKLELYRRIAAPYEDYKRANNGDVYSVDLRL